jgi:hypothetical protein
MIMSRGALAPRHWPTQRRVALKSEHRRSGRGLGLHVSGSFVAFTLEHFLRLFDTGAISDRSNDSIRSESALAACRAAQIAFGMAPCPTRRLDPPHPRFRIGCWSRFKNLTLDASLQCKSLAWAMIARTASVLCPGFLPMSLLSARYALQGLRLRHSQTIMG